MAKSIEPKLRKIGDYLKLDDDTTFAVPEYQRAYSWGIENCDKLWQDITDFVENGSKDRYFFGTIIVNCQDSDAVYSLIDGQQRTTTFLLLLKALLININEAIAHTVNDDDSASLCRGLRDRRRRIMEILYKAEAENIPDDPHPESDEKICSQVILLKNHSINEKYRDELKCILGAADFDMAEQAVVKIKYKRKDNRYTNYFRNFKYFYTTICQLSDSRLNSIAKAFIDNCEVIEIKSWDIEQAITMFNSLNSDGLPLNDADIISAKLYAAAEGQGCQKELTEKWEALNTQIDELEALGIANINSILMQYMYLIRTLNGETITESGSINVTTPGLRRYFTDLNKAPIQNPVKMCDEMLNLVNIWEKACAYPAMKVLMKFNENTKLFLASYFNRFNVDEVTEDDIAPVVDLMLRLFTVLELVDSGYSSSNFKTFLFGIEPKLTDSGISSDEIRSIFDKHIRSTWEEYAIRDEIQDYSGNALVYLNEYLFAKEHGSVLKIASKCDIEHIMPSSGHNLPVIKKDAGISDEDEFKNMVNKLGNKILLEEKINRSIGNEWFRTKVSTRLENKTGYVDSTYPIAKALVSTYCGEDKPYWTKDDIQKATEEAADRIAAFVFGKSHCHIRC